MNTPRLETERLVLRRFEPSDLQAFFQIFSDGEVNRFLPWFPVRDLEEAQAFYQQRYAPVYAKAQGYAYAICRKEDNVPIGYVNGETEGARDFGYGLRKEFWGQGIVTEASRAVLAQMKLLLPGAVAAQGHLRGVPDVPAEPGRGQQPGLPGVLGQVPGALCGDRAVKKGESRGSPFFVKIPSVWRKRRGWRPRLSSPASGPGG